MRISINQLRQIIKEEVGKAMSPGAPSTEDVGSECPECGSTASSPNEDGTEHCHSCEMDFPGSGEGPDASSNGPDQLDVDDYGHSSGRTSNSFTRNSKGQVRVR
jgi:hypothetical protein